MKWAVVINVVDVRKIKDKGEGGCGGNGNGNGESGKREVEQRALSSSYRNGNDGESGERK